MARIFTTPEVELDQPHLDLDFRDTETWRQFAGIPSVLMLFGDDEVGPYAFLSSSVPMNEQMPTGFSHYHPSDNWRISVRGTTNMGNDEYREGQFRYHDGGKPYPGDNLTWGPEGGFGLVLMGDRRGFAVSPINAELAEKWGPRQAKEGERLGITPLDPCPGAPAIMTTGGATSRAHLNGGFEQSSDWPEVASGVRVGMGLLGEPTRGPVVCLIDAAAGTVAWPARTLGTETLMLPVAGSATSGDDHLEQGSIRLEDGSEAAPLVAGEDGLKLVAVVGDRAHFRAALEAGDIADGVFASALLDHFGELTSSLGELTAGAA